MRELVEAKLEVLRDSTKSNDDIDQAIKELHLVTMEHKNDEEFMSFMVWV